MEVTGGQCVSGDLTEWSQNKKTKNERQLDLNSHLKSLFQQSSRRNQVTMRQGSYSKSGNKKTGQLYKYFIEMEI